MYEHLTDSIIPSRSVLKGKIFHVASYRLCTAMFIIIHFTNPSDILCIGGDLYEK